MPSPQYIAHRILSGTKEKVAAPITLELYPTLRCNLDCAFCDTTDRHKAPMQELPYDEWKRIIDEGAQMGVKQVFILGGGEPMIFTGIIDLMRTVKSHHLFGMLTTNGTFLHHPEKQCAILEMQWDELHISIDGATAKTHDSLRGKAGTFHKVIRAICALNIQKKRRNLDYPRLVFHTVITNQNYKELPQIIELAEAIGVERVDFDGLIAYKEEQQVLQLQGRQWRELQEIALEAKTLADKKGIQHTLNGFLESSTPRGTAIPQSHSAKGLKGAPCFKPWHHLVIQADGRTSPCCVLTGEGEAIARQNLSDFWQQSPYLQRIRQAMESHRPMQRCKECSPNILAQEREIQKAMVETQSPTD